MTTTTYISRQQMDALADAHFRAEQDGDIVAIIEGFASTPSTTSRARPCHQPVASRIHCWIDQAASSTPVGEATRQPRRLLSLAAHRLDGLVLRDETMSAMDIDAHRPGMDLRGGKQ